MLLLPPVVLQRNRRRRANPNPSFPANPLFKPLSLLKTPVKNAKNGLFGNEGEGWLRGGRGIRGIGGGVLLNRTLKHIPE